MTNFPLLFEQKIPRYCIDTSVFIDAWSQYYSPVICPSYWELLLKLNKEQIVILPEEVVDEILNKEDSLSKWLKGNKISKSKTDGEIINLWKSMQTDCPISKYLISNGNQHSQADPWVIAHAMKHNATVVTKEKESMSKKKTKVKIPTICKELNIRCLDDFQFIREMKIRFTCQVHD